MGKIISNFGTVAIAIFIVGGLYLGFRSIAAFRQGYSWKEMDWNNDGATSISEFFAASDIGARYVNINGKNCRQFYAYKDGLPVKTDCPL